MKENLELLKKLLNTGKLKIVNISFYEDNNFWTICRAGKVSEVINN